MQTFILSMIWLIGLMIVLVPVMFILTLLALISPLLANGAIFVLLTAIVLVDRPIVFYAAWDFCPQAERFLLGPHQFAMARFTLPTSGMFVISVFCLYRV